MRIEVLNSISGVLFDEAYARRLAISVGSQNIPMISLQDLLANKRASGRTEDLPMWRNSRDFNDRKAAIAAFPNLGNRRPISSPLWRGGIRGSSETMRRPSGSP
jgi:hypothetical protein